MKELFLPFKRRFAEGFFFCFFCFLSIALSGSCASQPDVDTLQRGTGRRLGTVFAAAAVSEDQSTGKITGDTFKYGYIDGVKVPNTAGRNTYSGTPKKPASDAQSAADKALANALYEIIQKIREKGGNAVTDVVFNIDRKFDPATKTETARVSVSAEAIKTDR